MEPKRLKYLRSKIERISEENENKTKSLQPSTKRRSSVTLLGHSSYHDQNKDLRIFNTFDDKFNSDPETITNYEEVCSGSLFKYKLSPTVSPAFSVTAPLLLVVPWCYITYVPFDVKGYTICLQNFIQIRSAVFAWLNNKYPQFHIYNIS